MNLHQVETRARVQQKYAASGSIYDEARLRDRRGKLRTELDLRLFLELLPPFSESWSVLEVGAGTGRFTLPALDKGYRLVASDINKTPMDQLVGKLERRNLGNRCEARREDVFALSFAAAQFDGVFSLHLIPRLLTLEDQRAAISEIARTVKPNGWFLFNYRNREAIAYGRFEKGHAARPGEIREFLDESGFEIERQLGKRILSRRLLKLLPLSVGRLLRGLDWRLRSVRPEGAWDVFVLARKSAHANWDSSTSHA
jgi:SAM-dependent methyltransferase